MPGPAVRLCTACGQLKSADQFQPGRGRRLACQACQAMRKNRRNSARTQSSPAAVWARARDRALRRLAAEHVHTYRELYKATLPAIPKTVPTDRARKRAVSQTLRTLEKQHRPRYEELYQQELERARSEPLPVRRGRPPGTPDRLSIASESWGSTWRRDGSPRPRRGRETKGARHRAELEAIRRRAAAMFVEGHSATVVADKLDVARQTAVRWHALWRAGGATALQSRGPSQRPAIPDRQLAVIEEALLEGAAAHGFDFDLWTTARVGVVIQRLTGVQLGRAAVQRLLRERLGWSFQQGDGRHRAPAATRTAAEPTGHAGGEGTLQRRG
jgi:transposase